MFQFQETPQPVLLLFCPQRDFDKGIGPDQHGTDRYHQQFNQIVLNLARLSRVADRYEYTLIDTNTSASRTLPSVSMAHPKKTESYTNQLIGSGREGLTMYWR